MKEQCEHGDTVARVQNTLNLDGLPDDIDRKEHVLDRFDELTSGHSLIVLDDCNLEWIEECLREHRPETFDKRFFHLHEEAGRKEACVKKRSDAD